MTSTSYSIDSCFMCELRAARYKIVNGVGPSPCRIMIIGEAPDEREDRTGMPFEGKAGKVLDAALKKIGAKRTDVYLTKVVKCRPPRNRKTTKTERLLCRVHLDKELAAVKPEQIVLLGKTATETFLPMTLGSFSPYVGKVHVRDFSYGEVNLIVGYDPMFINYNPDKMSEFVKTLKTAFTQYINIEK